MCYWCSRYYPARGFPSFSIVYGLRQTSWDSVVLLLKDNGISRSLPTAEKQAICELFTGGFP